MKKFNSKEIADSLGVTEQQIEIMLAAYRISSTGKRTDPKSIVEEYQKLHGRGIQSSNFFSQTKQLQDKGFLVRKGHARYEIDFDRIKSILKDKREEKAGELKEFDLLASQTAEYFRSVAFERINPTVGYLDYKQLFDSMTEKVRSAKRLYVVANFPTVAYTYQIAQGIGRGDFLKTLWDRCFEKESLEIYYLTTLDIDFPFNHAFRVYGDPDLAYKECRIIIDQLQNQIESHENLKIHYIKEAHGMDVLIPDKNDPLEFYLFTRDEHKNIQGGIHIQSPETASSAKTSFLRDFDYASALTNEMLSDLRNQAEAKYGKA